MAKILVIDDEEKILKLIKNALEINGHVITTINDASNEPIESFQEFDLILLDVMMPLIDGFTLCQKIRNDVECPILFLTAKTEEDAVVKGLISGGDDYIKKPFGVMELNARVEAHLRRENRKKQSRTLVFDDIVFHLDEREIVANGIPVILTKNQYNICEYLASNRGKVFTKEQIYEAVYSVDSDTLISTITEHIRVARKKFKAAGVNPIDTIWGVGYKWE